LPEYLVSIKIEKLDEGGYLATSDNLRGLMAQGRTVAETMDTAQDAARKLIESQVENGDPLPEDLHPPTRVITSGCWRMMNEIRR
jgi:predicted RNase H-like HicB family nuclease